jgi:hypothetical protein
MHRDIHASSEIRPHDLSVRAREDSSFLDRAAIVVNIQNNYNYINYFGLTI